MIVGDVQEDESEIYILGLRENGSLLGRSIIFFECPPNVDADDALLGMDSYCVVFEPGQATVYGGIRRCELETEPAGSQKPGVLILEFDEISAEVLGAERIVVLELNLAGHQLEMLREGLRRILASGRRAAWPDIVKL